MQALQIIKTVCPSRVLTKSYVSTVKKKTKIKEDKGKCK